MNQAKKFFSGMRKPSSIIGCSFSLALTLAAPHALAPDAAQRVKLLKERLQAIQMELDKVKSESSRAAQKVNNKEQTASQTVQKVNTMQQNNTALENRIAPMEDSSKSGHHHMLFFRGGFTHMMNHRNGVTIQNQVLPIGAQDQADKNGWYVGAGLDWSLTRNVWGVMPKTTVFAELMFEYKHSVLAH